MELDELAPGVLGYLVETAEALYVPLMIAVRPGQGAGGRFLDSLPRDRTVRIPCVLSSRLAGMLWRRDFRPCLPEEVTPGDLVIVWERKANGTALAEPAAPAALVSEL